MFSPIVAIFCVSSSATLRPVSGYAIALRASMSSASSASFARVDAKFWNSSLRDTKSVSEFNSIIAPRLPSTATATRPSAATRPDFFAAAARPFVRSQSTAASISPFVSFSAFLQSIMPAPDFSRNSLTNAAVTLIVFSSIFCN